MNKTLIILLSFLFISLSGFTQRNKKNEFKERNVLRERQYYPNGNLKYYNKTIRKGIKPHLRILGKQNIKLKEYYSNGQIELKERKILPRIVENNHLHEERHILRQKTEWRKYKKWNMDGDKIEKGKYDFHGNKKVIKYNYLNHKKVIIKLDKELNKDIYIKKKPIYKSNKRNK